MIMTTLTVTEARSNLYRLVDEASMSHEPFFIKGKRHNAVLLSEEDWRSIQESLYLVSIPGMVESIIEGTREPISECSQDIEFWPGK